MQKGRWAALLLLLSVLSLPSLALASPPYYGYVLDQAGRRILTPAPYAVAAAWYSFGAAGPLKEPQHLVATHQGRIWVADTGNNRVLQLTEDGSLLRELKPATGVAVLNRPSGLFVTEAGDLLVADTGNSRVVRFDPEGNFVREYPRPVSPLLGKDYTYAPIRVVEDRRGYLYVLNKGSSLGLMQIDPDGVFRGFFGANRVTFSWVRVFRNLFASEAQRERIVDEKPPVYTDVAIDADGFIYTVTAQAKTNQVKKLSPVGVDVLNRPDELDPVTYGELSYTNWRPSPPNFTGLMVDSRGIVTAVDGSNGRAYQYDQNRRLLFVFGNKSDQTGTTKYPVAVAGLPDGRLFILDAQRSSIQVFRRTAFASLVQQAIELYNDGRYEEAVGPWNEVLRLDARYDLAHIGLGRALLRAEDYPGAMREFRFARDEWGWSEAFGEWRRVAVRDHFAWVISGILLLGLGAVWLLRRLVRWLHIPRPWEVDRAA